jgi:hypothetical protein
MLPAQLTAEDFKTYPPKARAVAVENVTLLQDLPLSFTPFLLKEIIGYDWKFPAEQRELDAQLSYLKALWPGKRKREMERFAELHLDPKLESFDWVNSPAQFLEQLSAHLWATQQLDEFRSASEAYVHKFYETLRQPALPAPRLGIVVLGQGVHGNQYALFRKLRPRGIYFSQVNPAKGLEVIVDTLRARAADHPEPYGHWYIDGAAKPSSSVAGLTCISYDELAPVRETLAAKMKAAYESPAFSPEVLRTTLAEVVPATVGMSGEGRDGVLDRFALSLFTEGSGTQIYSTTFVQWAAREALRRAHPLSLLIRYAPRQRERSMDELLAGTRGKAVTDPLGSLIDADMGAYYTWLNQQRLTGADRSGFLVWFEDRTEAVAIGPGLTPGSVDTAAIDVSGLLRKVS